MKYVTTLVCGDCFQKEVAVIFSTGKVTSTNRRPLWLRNS